MSEEIRRPLFVVFGDTRVQLASITNYGISSETSYFLKVYVLGPSRFFKARERTQNGKLYPITQKDYLKLGSDLYCQNFFKKGDFVGTYDTINGSKAEYADEDEYHTDYDHKATKDDVVVKTSKYLYVTTTTGANHKFFEDTVDFDIEAKCKELDNLLS